MTDLSPTTSPVPDATTLPPVIQVEDAAIALGGRTIWQEVRLSVQAGEFLAIFGPNRAANSTLLMAILGLIPLSRGTLTVLAHPTTWGNATIAYATPRCGFQAD